MVGDLRPMRARAFSLLLPLLLSCAGKNVVSGDDKTPAERLDALLPNWCKDICSRLDSCATNQPCGCSGDSCDCVQPSADCPAECEQEMARFTRGNDACAAAGESYKSCLDGSTCQDLYDGVCMVSDRDERLCPRIKDNSTPPDAPTATGSGGTAVAGSANIDVGGDSAGIGGASAGGASASGGTSTGGPVVSCTAGYGSAGSAFGGGSSSLTCEEGRQYCSDGHDYNWTCVRNSQGRTGCTCFMDTQVTGGFDPGTDECPGIQLVNAGCGWNLEAT